MQCLVLFLHPTFTPQIANGTVVIMISNMETVDVASIEEG